MDIKKNFADPTLAKAGVWVPYLQDSWVKLAKAGNKKAIAKYDIEEAKHSKKVRKLGKLPALISGRISAKVTAEEILLGWRNFETGGEPLPYSQEAAEALLDQSDTFLIHMSKLASHEPIFMSDFDSEKFDLDAVLGDIDTNPDEIDDDHLDLFGEGAEEKNSETSLSST